MGFCSHLQIKFIYFICVLSILCACICAPCVYPVLQRSEEGIIFSGTEVMESVSWLCGHVNARN